MNQRIPKTNHPNSKESRILADSLADIYNCPHCGAINNAVVGLTVAKCVRCTKEITEFELFGVADKLSVYFIKQNTPSILHLVFQWLKEKSFHTQRPYLSRIKTFIEYCAYNELDPLKIDVEDIQTYHKYRSTIVETKTATEEVFTTMKSFYTFLYKKNLVEFHPVRDKIIQVPIDGGGFRQKIIPVVLEEDKKSSGSSESSVGAIPAPSFEMALMFSLYPILTFTWQGDPRHFPKDTMYHFRDGVLMLSLLCFGLRRKDPILMRKTNVDLEECLIYLEGRKNEHKTWVPIPKFLLPFFDYYNLCVLRRPAWRKNEQFLMVSSEKTIAKRVQRYYKHWIGLKAHNDSEIDKLQCAALRKRLLKQQNTVYFQKLEVKPYLFRRGEEKFFRLKPHGIFRKTWYTFVGTRLLPIIRNYLMGQSTRGGMDNLVSTYASVRDFVITELNPIINEIWDKISEKFDPSIIVCRENIISQVRILRMALELDPLDYENRYYTVSSTVICTKCGELVGRTVKFCPHCGESQESTIINIE